VIFDETLPIRRFCPVAPGAPVSDEQSVVVELHPFKSEVCVLAKGVRLVVGDRVIVRDEEGEDIGRVVAVVEADDGKGIVLRKATEQDVAGLEELSEKTTRVLELFRRQAREFDLPMKVVDAHWRWDRKKICFYFVTEQRLDFRALHKVISSALNIRVAIKQVGIRDHARIAGGIGPCGREICCRRFMTEMKPIGLRMARVQNLFVEPAKISGLCGKLLCCLSFEEDDYRRGLAEMPRPGTRVETARGSGCVVSIEVLSRRVKVKYDDTAEQTVSLDELRRSRKEDGSGRTRSTDGARRAQDGEVRGPQRPTKGNRKNNGR